MIHATPRRRLGLGALAAAAMTAVAGTAVADEGETAIYARQGIMNAMQLDVTPFFAMAKGSVPYDAEAATHRAEQLKILASYDIASLFLEGTGKPDRPGKTRAEPAIWSDSLVFEQDFEDLRAAVETMVSQAGAGQEAMTAAATKLGAACSECHKSFRAENY